MFNANNTLEAIDRIIKGVVDGVVNGLVERGVISPQPAKPKKRKTAVEKTELLLHNYCGLKRVVEEKARDIAELKKYGVPTKRNVDVRVQTSNVRGIVLEEESVQGAVHSVQASMDGITRVLDEIDLAMKSLENDPYYDILEMRYFEGRTQEDIADYYGCAQSTVSFNKDRLLKELAMRLFPDLVLEEMLE